MRCLRRSCLVVVALFLAVFSCESFAAAEASSQPSGALPRYNLPVGRKLTYSARSQQNDTSGQRGAPVMMTKGTWELTVTRENPDGSRHVIIRSASTFTQQADGQTMSQPERVSLAWADVFPDGRVTNNPTLGFRLDASEILPRLPASDAELASGWSARDEEKQQTTKYSASGNSNDRFTFTAVEDSIINKIYLTTSKHTYRFDTSRGVIASATDEMSQDYGFHTKGGGQTKLEHDDTIPAEQVAKMGEEFDRFFAARKTYEEKMKAAEGSATEAEKLAGEAKSALTSVVPSLSSDEVKKTVEELLSQHDEYAKYVKDEATKHAATVDKPAPDVEMTDLDGKTHKLADYRGKVVVLDFWYRGCGWCMYAMPQLKQIAEDFKDKPVALLGMNTDEDEKDARFVIDAMGLNYPTLKAKDVVDKFGVEAFPTLIVIDPQGVVREFHTSYSPTLRKDIGTKIQALIDGGAAKAGG